jgi:TonB-linked SusC/RagA family outer membrane protein
MIASLGLGVTLLLFCNASWAQQISGKVVSEDGVAIPGVNVIIEGTSIGTSTDADGVYTLNINDANATVVFSFIGYRAERVSVQNQSVINVTLLPDITTLSEIVVVGYGTQKKTSVTAAVSKISSDDVISRQAPNTISLLQGRTPGLQIVQNSALPGAEKNQIRIRGQGTFSDAGNDPLVLIDGVEGKLELLNPNMIEDISILKDAASAAIYGSRAANGVILVTTKKGKEGRINVEYSYNYSLQDPSIKIDRITDPVEYMELVNSAIDFQNANGSMRYSATEMDMYRADTIPTADWTKYLIRKGPIHKHFLNVSGGKENTTFNVGFGLLDETGLLIGTDYRRYDAQVNFKTNLGGRVTFGANLALANGKRHDTAYGTNDPKSNMLDSDASEDNMLAAYAAPPLSIPVLPDGSGRFTGTLEPVLIGKGGNKNPIAIANGGGGKEWINNYVLFSPYMNVKIIEGLSAEVKGAVRWEEEMGKAFVAATPTYEFFYPYNQRGPTNPTNQMFQRNTRQSQYTLFGLLTYSKTIGTSHTINAMVGYQQESYRNDKLEAFRTGYPTTRLKEIEAGPVASSENGGTAYEWAMQSFFGRINYDFKGKYLLEASFRDDASSRFPQGSKWAFFPSVSAGWRLAEESFLSGISQIDELKLRGSWGQLGNQNIGNYPYQSSLAYSSYNFNGVLEQGITLRKMVNENIRWETTTVTDIGLDFSFFNSKLYGSVDWYKKVTKDILRRRQLPTFTGFTSTGATAGAPYVNDGIMENIGWEFVLGHRNKIGDFGYSINANLETYKNELVKFGAREISGVNLRQEGQPYNTYYVYLQDGIYQTQDEINNGPATPYAGSIVLKPGVMRYKDVSGPNGVPDNRIDAFDLVPVEGVMPKFNYGINLTANYKSFDLSIFVQGVHGRKTYVTGWGVAPFQQASAPPVWWRDAWTAENPSNSIPHIYFDGWAVNNQVSTFWLGNSSYVRLKNVQLGYTLPTAWSEKVKLQSLRVYASADNLYTWTKYFQGLDPERATSASERAAVYPQATIYSFGVSVKL